MLGQQEESTLKTAHPQIVLIIFKQRPHIRRVQIERATDVIISLQDARSFGHPAKTLPQCSYKQIPPFIEQGASQLYMLITAQNAGIDEISLQCPVLIVGQTFPAHHQHASLIIDEIGHCAKGRLHRLNRMATVIHPDRDRRSGACLPEIPHFIDQNVAEVVVIAHLGIVIHRVHLHRVQVYTIQAVARCTHQQMIVILLQDIVHSGRSVIGEFQPFKLVIGAVIATDTRTTTSP